jgi:hypothetical protein
MDHHEAPLIGPSDGSSLDLGPSELPRAPSRRFVRSGEGDAPRRLAFDRLGRALLVSLVFVALAVAGGSSVSRTVVAWLHRRPEYRVRFDDIGLDPAPPPWIKGGRAALLEAIRDDRKHLLSFSILDLDLDRLLTDVRRNPWVARADRAAKSYPDRIAVALAYREPVALVQSGSGPPIPIDREGVALPADGLDMAKAGRLVTIEAESPATAPTPGLAWPGADDDRPDKPGPRARVLHAARLAGHLKTYLQAIEPGEWSPGSVRILVHEPNVGLWVEFDRTLVLWGRYATLGGPGEPCDDEKWRGLLSVARAAGGLQPLKVEEYLDGRDGMRVHTIP